MARLLFPLLFLISSMFAAAKEKCKVMVTAQEGVKPYELVIKKSGDDPKNSNLRTKLENGLFDCEIESDQIEMYSIVDLGEVLEKGSTGRIADFFIEDGATVKIHFDGNRLTVTSDGTEWLKRMRMNDLADEWQKARQTELAASGLTTDEQNKTLKKEYQRWKNDYYTANPMLSFLLDLKNELDYFRFDNADIAPMLDIYHQYYENRYSNHNVHAEIAQAEKAGYQILGKKYHDFVAYNTELEEVQTADYFRGKPTLVICWATWCLPCRQEAKELVPLYEKYRQRGLNAFSLAREFKTPDDMKAAVIEDNYPWPCLLDLDDKFKIFDHHGVTSSGLILIDRNGTIVSAGYFPEDITEKLEEILPEK